MFLLEQKMIHVEYQFQEITQGPGVVCEFRFVRK